MKLALAHTELLKLIADARLDPNALDFWSAWRLFKRYLREEVEGAYDAGSFQCCVFDDDASAPFVVLSLVRQFSRWEDGEDAGLRRVVLEFEYSLQEYPGVVEAEVWTHDFPATSDFASVVEGLPQFQRACTLRPRRTGVYSEEL
jgi:hypothetical protein